MKKTRLASGLGRAALALLLGSGLLLGGAGSAAADGHRHHRQEAVIKELPRGYKTVRVDRDDYYEHDNRFYRRTSGGFIAVRLPVGAVVASVPVGSLRVSIGDSVFFSCDDVYYRPAPRGYMVVERPVIRRLPAVAAKVGAIVVQAPLLNVRSGPGSHFPVIGRTRQGQRLMVSGGAPGWHYVQLPGGEHGWIMSCYASPAAAG